MLALGKSKPWPQILKQYTGSDKISNEPIKEYFDPLIKWLQDYRKLHKYPVGWDAEKGDEETKFNNASRTSTRYSLLLLLLVANVILFQDINFLDFCEF